MSMTTVTREHLAGLLAFKAACSTEDSINKSWLTILEDLIAQASAAPEQEAVAYCDDFTLDILKRGAAYSIGVESAKSTRRSENAIHPLYTDPSAEIERLQAENKRLAAAVEYNKAPDDAEFGPGHPVFEMADETDKANARAALAERRLADAQVLLRDVADHCNGCVMPTEALLSGWGKSIDAFLSATAQPAECAHRNRTGDGTTVEVCNECGKYIPVGQPAEVKS